MYYAIYSVAECIVFVMHRIDSKLLPKIIVESTDMFSYFLTGNFSSGVYRIISG